MTKTSPEEPPHFGFRQPTKKIHQKSDLPQTCPAHHEPMNCRSALILVGVGDYPSIPRPRSFGVVLLSLPLSFLPLAIRPAHHPQVCLPPVPSCHGEPFGGFDKNWETGQGKGGGMPWCHHQQILSVVKNSRTRGEGPSSAVCCAVDTPCLLSAFSSPCSPPPLSAVSFLSIFAF